MDLIRRFRFWLGVLITERLMWWRYTRNPRKYEATRMWQKIGSEALPVNVAYEQIQRFIKETVSLSSRPYGEGAYSLKVAAAWKTGRPAEGWQKEFTYQEREAAYTQLTELLEGWEPAPRVIIAGVLPYGALIKEVL